MCFSTYCYPRGLMNHSVQEGAINVLRGGGGGGKLDKSCPGSNGILLSCDVA